jgi:membrane-bound lytic murein transglycosylase D
MGWSCGTLAIYAGTARKFWFACKQILDERTDYFKSTHAAARYLTDLFSLYGDWLLVIAAYNGGPVM